MLQAVLRLFLFAVLVHTVGRLLRRARPRRSGGISQPGGADRVKRPRYDDLTPYEIDDADFEELPSDRR